MRMEAVDKCLLCGGFGRVIYEGIGDRLFHVLGSFDFYRCAKCDFIWLNPRPAKEDIPKCYEDYCTHAIINQGNQQVSFRKLRRKFRDMILCARYGIPMKNPKKSALILGSILGRIPILRRRVTLNEGVFPPWTADGRLLDIGCGNGYFLSFMQKIGWRVSGVDIDHEAARLAREAYKIPVFVGTLDKAGFSDRSFDAVTMSHVIEHAPAPVDLLMESYRIISRGGYLCIATPNFKSLGHSIFRRNWFALDPPRHLYLWTPGALYKAVEKAGFRILSCKTSSANAAFIFTQSHLIKTQGRANLKSPVSARARMYGWLEAAANQIFHSLGEDIYLLAQRKS